MEFVAVVLINFMLITYVLEANASWHKGTFQPAYGLPIEEMNNLTLAKFPEPSEIGCARLCSRYPGCTSFTLAPGLCTLMTARHNGRREQGGVVFYITKEVNPTCVPKSGSFGGTPFDLSSAYYASYHQITKISLYYHSNGTFLRGLEVEHGKDKAFTGQMTDQVYECIFMKNEFIQRWEYSTHMLKGDAVPVHGCVTLITTHKTCGPYGDACGSMKALEGYHLLYVAGRSGVGLDQVYLAFESC